MMLNAIKAGDKYRTEKYGNALGWIPLNMELWEKEHASQNPKGKKMTPQEKNEFKASFEFWDEWTGSRYERVRNKFEKLTDAQWTLIQTGTNDINEPILKKPNIVAGTICRCNPVTGEWKAI